MKTQKIILTLSAVALATWVVGCKQETNTAAEATKDAAAKTENAVSQAAEAVKNSGSAAKDAGAKVVEDVKNAGAQAAAAVTEKAKEVVAPASAKAQELIDSAKSLFTEGKFADALAKLKETSGETLSGEQTSVVDALKAQIEKAMTAASAATGSATKNAAEGMNNLLNK